MANMKFKNVQFIAGHPLLLLSNQRKMANFALLCKFNRRVFGQRPIHACINSVYNNNTLTGTPLKVTSLIFILRPQYDIA